MLYPCGYLTIDGKNYCPFGSVLRNSIEIPDTLGNI